MKTETRNKTCQNCENEFYGRLNQIYCTRKCKNEYNNDKAKMQKGKFERIFRILKTNRKVIQTLVHENRTKIDLDYLKSLGFNFNFITHSLKNESEIWNFCFDYGYNKQGNSIQLIHYDEPISTI